MSRVIDSSKIQNETISFAERFVSSECFLEIFKEGMGLVEQTANYLDTDGRREAKALSQTASLAYATESMRLTTRLMQMASWLLIQRAVNEGEMSVEQAMAEKHKVKIQATTKAAHIKHFDELPSRLQQLIKNAERLHDRIHALDRMIHEGPEEEANPESPLSRQFDMLQKAFGANEVSLPG
jgi:regulator of CtrA degradation